ncbi:MAG: antitoxin Xre/MbcA/ParS toxin-binding domain-containing protein [Owenweeksia sp.]|nr:antitoxin Xre/MbcA/ParS toxin-binding domain-containing protein [Owenweeksia sp.]
MNEDAPKYGHGYIYLGGQDIVNEPLATYALQSRILLIRRGLPLHSLNYFLKKSKLNRQELANILQISPRTMQRYSDGHMLPSPVSEKLLRLNDLYQQAEDVLGGGPENITAWLRSEIPALGDQHPLDLLDTYEGLDIVINVLGRLEWGVAS